MPARRRQKTGRDTRSFLGWKELTERPEQLLKQLIIGDVDAGNRSPGRGGDDDRTGLIFSRYCRVGTVKRNPPVANHVLRLTSRNLETLARHCPVQWPSVPDPQNHRRTEPHYLDNELRGKGVFAAEEDLGRIDEFPEAAQRIQRPERDPLCHACAGGNPDVPLPRGGVHRAPPTSHQERETVIPRPSKPFRCLP